MEEEDIVESHLGDFLRGMRNATSNVIIVEDLNSMHMNVGKKLVWINEMQISLRKYLKK